jgi:hypothetical protein
MEERTGNSTNVKEIREILRFQFEAAASTSGDSTKVNILRELSATTEDVPDALIKAYWEIFEAMRDKELEYELLRDIGVFYWPESATNFVRKFISISTGGD